MSNVGYFDNMIYVELSIDINHQHYFAQFLLRWMKTDSASFIFSSKLFVVLSSLASKNIPKTHFEDNIRQTTGF